MAKAPMQKRQSADAKQTGTTCATGRRTKIFFARLYCTCDTTSLARPSASTIVWHSFLRRTV